MTIRVVYGPKGMVPEPLILAWSPAVPRTGNTLVYPVVTPLLLNIHHIQTTCSDTSAW